MFGPALETMTPSPRFGVTLVELVVALTLLGLMAAVVGVAIPRQSAPNPIDQVARAIAHARQSAIDSGHVVTITIVVAGLPHTATALPDGSVLADDALDVERLSGAVSPRQPDTGRAH